MDVKPVAWVCEDVVFTSERFAKAHSDYLGLPALPVLAPEDLHKLVHMAGQYDSIVRRLKPSDRGRYRADTIESIELLIQRAEAAEFEAARLRQELADLKGGG